MSSKSPVFISYRRSDSQHATGRLFARMAPRYLAEAEIFMDTAAIAAGADFANDLDRELAACKVCLVMIGPRWLSETDERGSRRLDNPADYVRMEIAAALTRNITVVPVLVDNARMPAASELPEPLRGLTRLNAVSLNHEHFDSGADRLSETVLRALGRSADPELDVLKLFFSFKGTISRKRFWLGILVVYAFQFALLAALYAALGVSLTDGFAHMDKLTLQQKALVQIANIWPLWSIFALSWKRIRDLGHGWDFFVAIVGATLIEKALFLSGLSDHAATAAVICVLLLVILGVLKGTRFVVHSH